MFEIKLSQGAKPGKPTGFKAVFGSDVWLEKLFKEIWKRGLDITDKSERVKRYAESMHHEVGVIAHPCGVTEPRRLKRFHCRIVQANGCSIAMNELYPDVRVLAVPEYDEVRSTSAN